MSDTNLEFLLHRHSAKRVSPEYAEKMMANAVKRFEYGSAVAYVYGTEWCHGVNGTQYVKGPYYLVLRTNFGQLRVSAIYNWDIDGLLSAAGKYNFTEQLGSVEALN